MLILVAWTNKATKISLTFKTKYFHKLLLFSSVVWEVKISFSSIKVLCSSSVSLVLLSPFTQKRECLLHDDESVSMRTSRNVSYSERIFSSTFYMEYTFNKSKNIIRYGISYVSDNYYRKKYLTHGTINPTCEDIQILFIQQKCNISLAGSFSCKKAKK